jgi:hypothetical protein
VPQGGTNASVYLDVIEFDTESVLQTASVAAQPLDAWHLVGAAGEPAFTASWQNYGAGQPTLGFRKYPDGKVRLKGLISRLNVTTGDVFTLPVGYRPPSNAVSIRFTAPSNKGAAYVEIYSADGRVSTSAPGSFSALVASDWLDLSVVEFDTETVAAYASGIIGPSRVTALPANPVDGQECYFVADAANGVLWHLRFNAASASAYKWEFVGGSPLFTSHVGGTTSATTPATGLAGPSIVVPLAGEYMFDHAADLFASTAVAVIADLFINAVIANLRMGIARTAINTGGMSGRQIKGSVSGAGQTALIRYWTTAATANIENAEMTITPVRVG